MSLNGEEHFYAKRRLLRYEDLGDGEVSLLRATMTGWMQPRGRHRRLSRGGGGGALCVRNPRPTDQTKKMIVSTTKMGINTRLATRKYPRNPGIRMPRLEAMDRIIKFGALPR